jgi:RNA polymerase sigma-70 factor, ECF subfamily
MAAPVADPDLALVRLAATGDHDAFEQLVHRHSRRAFAVAMSVVRDVGEAEEVVQETFLSAFTHLAGFREEAKFSTWLTRVAMNHALMRVRKKRPQAQGDVFDLENSPYMTAHTQGTSPFDALSQWAKRPDDAAHDHEVQTALDASLDELPASERGLLLLRALDDTSHEDLAATFETTVPAIKSRLHRARLLLRQHMALRLRGHGPQS